MLTPFLLLFLACGSEKEEESGLLVYQDDYAKDIAFIYNGELLTILRYTDSLYKPFFHPVNTLKGTPVTRGWPVDPRALEPVDHPHQTGLWLNFGDVNSYDFWNNKASIPLSRKARFGVVKSKEVQVISHDSKSAQFLLLSEWIGGNHEKLILDSSFLNINVEKDHWWLQRKTILTAMDTLRISDNKEGLFAIRVARELQSDTGSKAPVLDSSLNVTKQPISAEKNGIYFAKDRSPGEKIWGTTNPWVGLKGIINGDSVSVVIFDHPDNINHPPRWHAREYGLFSVNNFGNASFDPLSDNFELHLIPGDPIILLHKVHIFNNHPEIPILDSLYQSFSSINNKLPTN